MQKDVTNKLFVITRSVSKFRSCLKILIFLLTLPICTHDLKHLGQSLSEVAFDSIHYPSFMFLTIHDFIKGLDPLWYGAVHKLCRLKIGDFIPPPPPLLVVFLLCKIGKFCSPPLLRLHSLWTAPFGYFLYNNTYYIALLYPCMYVCSCTYCHVFACDFLKIEYYLTDIYKS